MGHLASRETIQLIIGQGLWIEVKKELTYGEQRKLRSAIVAYDFQGQPKLKDSMEEAQPLLIAMTVTDWNLEDDEGNKLPVTVEAIDNVKPDIINKILETIGILYASDDGSKNEK